MEKRFNSVLLEVTTTDIAKTVNALTSRKIELHYIEYIDEITVRLRIDSKYLPLLRHTIGETEKVKIIHKQGISNVLAVQLKRPVFLFFTALIIFLSLYLPTRILFIKVDGNQTIPANYILAQAEGCGIKFWTNRREIRSEQIKNALLERIPQLKWAAITTNGATATIHVREEVSARSTKTAQYGHLVATTDGIVRSVSITRGTPLCQVGDAVQKGQMLASGYTDCGLSVLVTGAEGEIYAGTQRGVRCVSIKSQAKVPIESHTEKRYTIRIGKKLIKLYKDSGISDASCDKIYSERSVDLLGNGMLPLGLQCESVISVRHGHHKSQSADWMEDYAESYVISQMIAGQILNRDLNLTEESDIYVLGGTFFCDEMIALIKYEENITQYAENN